MTAAPTTTSAANERTVSDWRVGPPDSSLTATVIETGLCSGLPIVFLHGLVGLNEHWEGVVDRISNRSRCVLFELPLLRLRGDDCSIHGATRLTAQFLGEKFGGQPVVLVGNSFGGHVALRIALEHPQVVKGLVLAGSSGLIEKNTVDKPEHRPSREWLTRKIGELFYDKSKMREADIDRAHAELSDKGGARAMVRLSKSARRDHLGDRISEIAHPTLLIWGKQDVVTPPEACEGFKRMIRNSTVEWLDNCGHAPMIEQPELFADALLRFAGELGRFSHSGNGKL